MKTPDILYHYTIGPKLRAIAAAAHLVPKGYGLATATNELPVLWLSENPQWEPTANKVMSKDGGKTFTRPTLRELQRTVGVYRFALDTRHPEAKAVASKLVPWTRLPVVARIAPRDVADMIARGMKFGSTPTHWWGVLDPLPLALMESGAMRLESRPFVEPGQGPDQWVRAELQAAIDQFEETGLRVGMTTTTEALAARNV